MIYRIILKRKRTIYKFTCCTCTRQYSKPVNLMSKIFQPINLIPKDAQVKNDDISSKSQKLLLDMGYIKQGSAPGTYCLLSLAQRSLDKLVKIVEKELKTVGAQRISLPALTLGDLWKTSGRWQTAGAELFRLQDRHKQDVVLSPTHEEAITHLLSNLGVLSHRQLPLNLYQISSKFRDEAKQKSGLLRAREFLMKDLYTFDCGLEEAKQNYLLFRDAYHRIFSRIGVKYVTVVGDATSMGGSASEEFHIPADVGEDHLVLCSECGHGSNAEMTSQDHSEKCQKCGSNNLSNVRGIEVGHCFILGTRYSEPLQANFLNVKGKPVPVHMGCHGLGLTRILAAVAECMSSQEELHWPLSLAPYSVCVIPPKDGSKEAAATEPAINLYSSLDSLHKLHNDILLDDRGTLTIGRRLRDAKRSGYPYIIVAGKSALGSNPEFELHDGDTSHMMNAEAIIDFVKHKCDPK